MMPMFGFFIALITLYLFDGTGNEADSINHYLFAKYAPLHPELYLDHWAKPIFTLLASPFAQFGFKGVQFFNVLCSLFSIYFAERIAIQLKLKFSILVGLFYFLLPLTYLVVFTGLTEPLGGLLLTVGIYLALQNKLVFSAIVISFLPFVRSEGLIIIGVFSMYFLANKKYKPIPYLLMGHLAYSLVGWSYYQDFFWVFTKIPYASLSSHYGSGTLSHFPEQFIYVTGIPLLILFCIGLIGLIFTQTRKGKWKNIPLLLITSSFICFFSAHTLFWKFGLFNSMGLKRVLGCLLPIIAIISLYGFNYATKWIMKKSIRHSLQGMLIVYSIIFIFTSNPAAVDWEKDMNLTKSQELAHEVSTWIQKEYISKPRLIYSDPYLSEVLDIDPFNQPEYLELNSLDKLKYEGIIIWDSWHSVVDCNITLEELERNPKLKKLKSFESPTNQFVVFTH